MKDTLTEMRNNLQEISSIVDETESKISSLECKEAKNTHSEQGGRKNAKKLNEDTIWSP